MKKTLLYIFAGLFAMALMPVTTGCADMEGDGIDSVLWEGSTNPENTQFRNPAIEPSVEAGTVFRGSAMYVALSATSQWTPGLTQHCLALTSNNVVNWSVSNSTAFTEETLPLWATGRINSLSADYAKTVARANNWLFYTTEGTEGIGAAYSATAAQGPYTDLGQLALKTTTAQVANPFFLVASAASNVLCYDTEDGVYLQELTLKAGSCTLKGSPTLIAGTQFTDICLYRESASNIYLFGVCDGEIRYARAESIKGPYLDKNGTSILEGSKGEPLIAANGDYVNPTNPMRAFLNEDETHLFLCYNATEAAMPTMASGYARRPMFIEPIELDEAGWLVGTHTPKKGWTGPRF